MAMRLKSGFLKPIHYAKVLRRYKTEDKGKQFMKSFQDQLLKPHVLHSDPHMVDSFMFTTVTGLLSAEKSVKGAAMFKAFPVDMSQYRNLFNFSRIPKLCIDRLYQDERAKHVLVLRKGHLYVFDVLDNDGNIIPRGEIFNCIRHILSLERDPCVPGLGALTTLDRNTWAVLRKRIRETSPANAESLQAIDSAIMALCLDDCCESDIGSLLYSILCGNGVNRWFDKSFNLVVNESGEAGINYEPSWGDGIALIRYINEIYRDSTKNPLVFPETEACGDAVAKVKRLEFCFAADIFDTIREKKCQYEHHIKGVEVNTLSYKELGKKYCQSNNLNTDAMVQLAIQLAYYKLKDMFVTAYEPCSTGLFKHGRTEAIRPTTMETKEFCRSVTAACPPSKSELRDLLNKCSTAHEKLMKEAAMGQGFDQHLFALRAIAEKKLSPSELPEIFLDPGYEIINHNILSTCHLASPSIQAGTFGPRGKDGLGIGYRLLNDSVNIFITNYGEYYCGSEVIECINSALNDIYCIIHET
ncbi:carnitine O-palmitoyltransferase 2, mitochondrial-like [Hetaerina americana]|uniref:carnitine O-palmitoyltransferase 2, mitochondrial-like n=1 Tax=Hetaerina americana TaxID=62018 RepID=UPI003A7F55B5